MAMMAVVMVMVVVVMMINLPNLSLNLKTHITFSLSKRTPPLGNLPQIQVLVLSWGMRDTCSIIADFHQERVMFSAENNAQQWEMVHVSTMLDAGDVKRIKSS